MTLPAFRYHPDPVASGSVVASNKECACCEEARGYIYAGPVYGEDELDDALCPWCIANGRAYEHLDATFVDDEALGEDVPENVRLEIVTRTPGFATWQSEHWPVCCSEPAAFVTPAGYSEIHQRFPQMEGSLLSHIIYEWGISGRAALKTLESLDVDRGPTAYVFQCHHCQGRLFHLDRP